MIFLTWSYCQAWRSRIPLQHSTVWSAIKSLVLQILQLLLFPKLGELIATNPLFAFFRKLPACAFERRFELEPPNLLKATGLLNMDHSQTFVASIWNYWSSFLVSLNPRARREANMQAQHLKMLISPLSCNYLIDWTFENYLFFWNTFPVWVIIEGRCEIFYFCGFLGVDTALITIHVFMLHCIS